MILTSTKAIQHPNQTSIRSCDSPNGAVAVAASGARPGIIGPSTLLFLLCDAKLACNVGQSDENVLRCCFFLSSLESAETPNNAVEEEDEDMVLCIESGRALDLELGSKSDERRAVRLPLRGGAPRLNRLVCEPVDNEVAIAGDDGESNVDGIGLSVPVWP